MIIPRSHHHYRELEQFRATLDLQPGDRSFYEIVAEQRPEVFE